MSVDAADRTIPIPPDFPIAWDDPHDPERFFERETQHFPEQLTALEGWFIKGVVFDQGFNGGCGYYGLPVRNTVQIINAYTYQSIAPVSHDKDELEQIGRAAVEKVARTFGKHLDTWNSEYLPEIKEHVAFWESFDAASASDEEFAAFIDESVERYTAAWLIHFKTVIPVLLGMSMFDDMYAEVFRADDGFASFRLLQGLDNMTLVVDRAFYAGSESARSSDAVRAALPAGDAAAVLDALESTDEGRAFRAELDGFLQEFGKRHDGYVSVGKPSWIEDPSAVLENIRDYVEQLERDPDAELAELAAERERALIEARARLEDKPEELRQQFELLLKAGQDGTILQEDHNFWIDARVNYELRQTCRAAGERLAAAGVIASADDVVHLTVDDIRSGLAGTGHRAAVEQRKAELARFAGVQSPPVLGTLPPGPPPDDPIARAVFKMFGAPPPEHAEAEVLTGMPGSAGSVRGPARIIASLDDAGSLQPGEVLVAATASPPWTPLFATAAAVVTDTGGILSHCAVVAREYEIPAVVGTKKATAVISDGDLIEVDGDAGTVRVLEGA